MASAERRAARKKQWHPVFAELLRPLVESPYEVEANVPVGDAPRQADFVSLRRTRAGPLPAAGLWHGLTTWNVLEFKGPTVSRREEDLDLLAEGGLGVHRRFNEARARGGRIVAVGTTSMRLLESAAHDDGTIQPFSGETSIFITPGYRFRAVDIMLTNFHLPRSTLFMLVAAFSGLDTMKAAYAHAIGAGYRFYSYGDACLLWRA